jgi:hypothetical protein
LAKGLFTPLNPEKYLGDPTKIRFLSSWEARFMTFCDNNPNVIEWASEEIHIKYFHPVKKKLANYIPDFIIKYRDRNGNLITEMIEIKPRKQAMITKRMTNYEKVSLVINRAKWEAAEAYCKLANIRFRVLTEEDLFR